MEAAPSDAVEKQIGHGEATVSYGSGEKPRYSALARTIQQFYEDLQPPLADLREAVFAATQLEDVQKADAPFRFGAKMRRVIDRAIERFLEVVAGPDRTREGYVNGGAESDQSDGILQQRQILAYSVGLRRASDLMGAAQTLVPSRQDPAVKEMLNHAFDRLTKSGEEMLHWIRDDVHSILVSSTEAGLSPIEVGRLLTKNFDGVAGYRFEAIARTEAASAAIAGNREQFRDFGVLWVQWLLSSGACSICQAYQGQVISVEDEANHPPGHVNCVCDLSPYLGGPL